MPTPRFLIDGDEALRLYQQGFGLEKLADHFGCSMTPVRRCLIERRVTLDGGRYRRISLPDVEVCSMYLSGIGAKGIADHFHTDRPPVYRALKKNGIKLRNRHEQQAIRMKIASAEERKRLTQAANQAARGRNVSLEERSRMVERGRNISFEMRCRIAKTKEAKAQFESAYEEQVFTFMKHRGLFAVPQRAIGPYNTDLSVDSVAVEIWAGNWHWYGSHIGRTEKRFRYIMNCGWSIYVLAINKSRRLTGASMEYAISEIKRLSAPESVRREYRVVWGAGDCFVGGYADANEFSVIPPFSKPQNSTNR